MPDRSKARRDDTNVARDKLSVIVLNEWREKREKHRQHDIGAHEERAAMAREARAASVDAIAPLQRRMEEMARTMDRHYAEHRREVGILRAQIETLQLKIGTIGGDIVLSAEEWSALGDILEHPPEIPDFLRDVIRRR